MDYDDAFDEFGNLIGDPSDSDADSSENESMPSPSLSNDVDVNRVRDEDSDSAEVNEADEREDMALAPTSQAASLVPFSPSVKTIVMKPYEMGEDVPVIEPVKDARIKIDYGSSDLPAVNYSREYMLELATMLPERVRNVALVGARGSGKTSLCDTLVLQTHPDIHEPGPNQKSLRFTDTLLVERSRGLSIRSNPLTFLLPDLKAKSHVLNIIDSPGHFDFADEMMAALQLADGAALVVDAVEGVTVRDIDAINQIIRRDMPFILIINKIDRLILDLRLTPQDAYTKLANIIDSANQAITECEYIAGYSHTTSLSPTTSNVVFASSLMRFSFTLASFAQKYLKDSPEIDPVDFINGLWGNVFYDAEQNEFLTTNSHRLPHTFVSFILEPIYKLFTYTLTAPNPKSPELKNMLWKDFKIKLPMTSFKGHVSTLLREVLSQVFPQSEGLVLSISQWISPPVPSTNGAIGRAVKLMEKADAQSFDTLVKVCGQEPLRTGDRALIIGQDFATDKDDFSEHTITALFVPGGRYLVPVNVAPPGSIVIVSGIDSIFSKGAHVFPSHYDRNQIAIEPPTDYAKLSVLKFALEPAHPKQLPLLLEGLRKVSKMYLASVVLVEDSGEHVILGPGQLYLDCALHDLRLFYTDNVEVRVSDPLAKFAETCSALSSARLPVVLTNGLCKVSITAEPMNDPKLSRAIENGQINLSQPIKTTSRILKQDFGWDALAARSVWCFGPNDMIAPDMLIDDTLEGETDKAQLAQAKPDICTGFTWSTMEGPLCDEPIRNTKFKILDATFGGSEIQRSGTQVIPMIRRACYAGFLSAQPRLMEPIYAVHATCSPRAIPIVAKLVAERRGYISIERPIPGTSLTELEGIVPVIDSIGLETDIRIHTQNQAMCYLVYSNWNIVPGDPLDGTVHLPALQPVPTESLARDFVMKTRRRKGLSGEPALQKYVDPELYGKLKHAGIIT